MGFVRKYLSADGLVEVVRHSLRRENLTQVIGSTYSWQDCVMSGLAIFGFKSAVPGDKRKAGNKGFAGVG